MIMHTTCLSQSDEDVPTSIDKPWEWPKGFVKDLHPLSLIVSDQCMNLKLQLECAIITYMAS